MLPSSGFSVVCHVSWFGVAFVKWCGSAHERNEESPPSVYQHKLELLSDWRGCQNPSIVLKVMILKVFP